MRTRLNTLRFAAPLLLAGVGLSAAAGCSAGPATAGSPAVPAATTASAPAPAMDPGSAADTKPAPEAPAAKPAGKPAGAPAGAPAARPGTAACTSRDIKTTVIGQPDRTRGTTRMALLMLVNTSKSTCSLKGWVSVALVNAAGDEVRVPTVNVSEPGAPTPSTLRPGGSAAAGMKWTVCDKGDDKCAVGNGLRVGPPKSGRADAALEEFPSAEKSGITMASLKVGSLQPSRQGVVAW